MTSLTRPQRARRGRIVLAMSDGSADALAARLTQPVARVANLFEAIGEVVAATAAEPVIAVFIDQQWLSGLHANAPQALRKVDPSVRVVGVSSSSAPPAAQTSGIDAWISLTPLRDDELRRALDDDSLVIDEPDAAATSISPQSPAPAGAPSIPSSVIELDDAPFASEASSTGASATAPVVTRADREDKHAGADCQSTAPSPSPAPTGASAPAAMAAPVAAPTSASVPRTSAPPTAAIGDTDLINAVLHDPAGVAPTALRVIAYHTNWPDARIADTNTDAAGSNRERSAEIIHGSRRFGRLYASAASPLELRLWADWLAHWMAIEHSHRASLTEALTDDLTTAGNRRFFERFLNDAIAAARRDRRPLSVMVFDIDNFKTYNDQFGHAAGDDILREIVRMLKSVIRQGDAVCRIGGDEFVVVFADSAPPRAPGSRPLDDAEAIARRFQAQVCSMRFPKLGLEAPGTLSISAGLATYPWDGHDPQSLLQHADELALESKRRGKNALTVGRAAADLCQDAPATQ
jgi:diguanylate cyclase (GGDEF)-like protein